MGITTLSQMERFNFQVDSENEILINSDPENPTNWDAVISAGAIAADDWLQFIVHNKNGVAVYVSDGTQSASKSGLSMLTEAVYEIPGQWKASSGIRFKCHDGGESLDLNVTVIKLIS